MHPGPEVAGLNTAVGGICGRNTTGFFRAFSLERTN